MADWVYICNCPQLSNSDIRCHNCGEYVNKLCWKCKTPRGDGRCPNPKKATSVDYTIVDFLSDSNKERNNA